MQSADNETRYAEWAKGKLTELVKKLTIWGQSVQAEGVEIGPAFARLKVVPSGSKTTINRIRDKAEDVKIHLGLETIPLIDSQASYVSVDVKLPERRVVTLDEALAPFEKKGKKAAIIIYRMLNVAVNPPGFLCRI